MIRGETLTAIIPVRSGSKGVPRKNMAKIGGKSILKRAIDTAISSRYVDQTFVSTDDQEMHRVAAKSGVAARNLRPAYLATDDALTIDVVNHLIKDQPIDNGYVLLLQTTCPFRTANDLDRLCHAFEQMSEAHAIVSLTELQDPHPVKVQKITDGWVGSYMGVESMVPRQKLPPVFRLNGAFYLTHRQTLLEKRTFLPELTAPFVMEPNKSVNIDTAMDLRFAEFLVREGLAPSQ